MPRAAKNRKICCIPKCKKFRPIGGAASTEEKQPVILTLEEVEAVRLADLEGLDQDTAASRMEISRTTFQRILHAARRAIADALVNGRGIEFRGGCYTVADCACEGEAVCQDCRFRQKAPEKAAQRETKSREK